MTGHPTQPGSDDGSGHPSSPGTLPYQPPQGVGPLHTHPDYGVPDSRPADAPALPPARHQPPGIADPGFGSGGRRPPLSAPADPATVTLSTRFAQLTYSHADRQDGSPIGWDVQDTEGPISPEEVKLLLSRVSTTGFPHLPAVLDAAQRADRPTQLIYAPTPERHAGWWHTIPAGRDATGRPGNVFAHLILDRAPTEHQPAFRASNLIGWSRWLSPYGQDEVRATRLRGMPDPSQAEPGVSREVAITFLVAAVSRLNNLFCGVLDAVAAAMAGEGPMVVLGVADPSRLGLWVAGLSQLMAPATSRRFFWSIGGQASGIPHLRGFGVHLVVLPGAELAALPADPGILVIEESLNAISLGMAGSGVGDHTVTGTDHTVTGTGARIRATVWSEIASQALQDRDVAARVLDRLDIVAAEIEGDMTPGWPLAMATREMPEELRECQGEAGQLLTQNLRPRRISERLQRALQLIESNVSGATPQDALDEVNACAPTQPAQQRAALRKYVVRAMFDSAWLCRAPGVPVPEEVARTTWDSDVKGHALDAVERMVQDPESDPVAAVRLVDFLCRAKLTEGPTGIDRRIQPLLERTAQRLLSGQGPGLVKGIGPVSERIQKAYVRPSIDRALSGRPHQQVPAAVLAWLFPTPPTPPSPGELGRGDGIPATLIQVAVQATRIVPDSTGFRLLALWSARDRGMDVAEEVERFSRVPLPWRVDEITALLGTCTLAELAPILAPALRTLSDEEGLRRLVDHVLDDPEFGRTNREVYSLAGLRRMAHEWWRGWSGESGAALASRLLDHLEKVLRAKQSLELASDVVESVMAAYVVTAALVPSRQPPRSALISWLEGATHEPGYAPAKVVKILVEALENRAIPLEKVVLAAQLGFARLGGAQAGWAELDNLAQITAEPVEHRHVPVLDLAVWQWDQEGDERGRVDTTQTQTNARLWYLQHVNGDPAKLNEYDSAARQWWKHVLNRTPDPATPATPKATRGWRRIHFLSFFGGSR